VLIWTPQNIKRRTGDIRIMVGRPRKIGKRGKTGRLIQTYVNPRQQVAEQPHRREAPARMREWPEAETRFGRLMLWGHITPAQYEAGKRYAEDHASYRAAMAIPAPAPTAMSYEQSSRGVSAGMADKTAVRARKRFTGAFNAIESITAQIAVMHHAVHDEPIASFERLDNLRCGLDPLVDFYGIDKGLQISRTAKCRVQ
jgi:hypothetical protein